MYLDLKNSISFWRIWLVATVYRIVLTYRRTYLGTTWLLIGITLVVLVKSLLFAGILDAPSERIIPNLAIGMAMWRLVAGIINSSANAITANKASFEQGYFPLFVPVMERIVHNGFAFLHSIVPMIVISLYFVFPNFPDLLLIVPAIVLIIVAALPIGFVLSVVCTRYRDVGNLVSAIMGVAFFLTPVIWIPEMAQGAHEWFLWLNPLYHFIEIIRDPLIGQPVEMLNWLVAFGISVVSWLIAYGVFRLYGRRILIWL